MNFAGCKQDYQEDGLTLSMHVIYRQTPQLDFATMLVVPRGNRCPERSASPGKT